jgi:hypothetical protein
MTDKLADNLRALDAMARLLAAATHRSGGVIEVSEEQDTELRQLYGEPAPLIVGADDDGLFCALFTAEESSARAWPFIQRASGCSEEAARAAAETMVAALKLARIRTAERVAEAKADRAAERN